MKAIIKSILEEEKRKLGRPKLKGQLRSNRDTGLSDIQYARRMKEKRAKEARKINWK